ncbi:WD40 repeat protein [Plasmopara halstedii]|uniref:WD40 repeat protein n=1 Tax=Plasmopara halstedii TaxID=4781 RepID=A0A0P1A6C2_PLAHL|nr:WD40 repeat protein [Plasmopara halstedii]CEG35471.1 WD40 repeat protein [Plasmopara halstedii]|eukprot:XP_024571840.1 WD40 repeat protein [Plasmopara halstedii]
MRGLSLARTTVAAFASPSDASQSVLNPYNEFDYDYVLDCKPMALKTSLALALSNYKVQLRNLETLELLHEFNAHASTINEVWTSPSSPFHLATCSSDQYVKLWDTRVASPTMEIPVGREVWSLSIGCSETLLATGTDDLALFYDVRTGKNVGQYGESLGNAITKVRFHPTQQAFVVTASEDGVVCFFDCRIPDEDDAIESILNVESAVTTIGFFGPQRENIFCLTGTETIDLWNIWTAERLHHYDTIRDDCNKSGIATDYLIDCVYEDQSNELFLLAGNHNGDLNIVTIGTDATSAGQIKHEMALESGHKACIRCIYYDSENSTLYTGGEDTRLCKWAVPGASAKMKDSHASSVMKVTGLDSAGIRKARKAVRPY